MAKFKLKILVVDDEPEARTGLARALQARGYEVIEVDTGQEALARAQSEWPSLIVLDIVLPDIPGTEVFDRLRQDPLTKTIPVLLLTAKPEVVDKLTASSASRYHRAVEKPGRVEDLVQMVQDMLTGKR